MDRTPAISDENLVRYFYWLTTQKESETPYEIRERHRSELLLRHNTLTLRGEGHLKDRVVKVLPLGEEAHAALEYVFHKYLREISPNESELRDGLKRIKDLLRQLVKQVSLRADIRPTLDELRLIYRTPNVEGTGPMIARAIETSALEGGYKKHLKAIAKQINPEFSINFVGELPPEDVRFEPMVVINNVLGFAKAVKNHEDGIRKLIEEIKRPSVQALMKEKRVEELTSISQTVIENMKRWDFTTFEDISRNEHKLTDIQGIGEVLAQKIISEVRMTRGSISLRVPFVLDAANLDKESVMLVNLVFTMIDYGNLKPTGALEDNMKSLIKMLTFEESEEFLAWANQDEDLELITEQTLHNLEVTSKALGKFSLENEEKAKTLLTKRASEFYAYLIKMGAIVEDDAKTHGFLNSELVKKIKEYPLNQNGLKASLRPYQLFGVQYACHQERVLIGDEMGLGKTLQAIAVMQHLANQSQEKHHFLVVCPLPVIVNWIREIEKFSGLKAHRLHGAGFTESYANWRLLGGAGVTTYETLNRIDRAPNRPSPSMLVVDEAHFIKNPRAARTQFAMKFAMEARSVIFLSGTPLENKLKEFTTLLDIVQPTLRITATDKQPEKFRQEVAAVYLRRNREDVLKELPPLVDQYEWLDFSEEDFAYYRASVEAGDWHDMRRAGFKAGAKSSKLQRLLEIAEEARDNGRKVLVFTYYLSNLEAAQRVLTELNCYPPIRGGVDNNARQEIIDKFTADEEPAILLAQITSGGTGLNIQAASVVVLLEPQVKPSIEEQAISRSYRMGQANTVFVHRLNSAESIDERMVDILRRKSKLAEDFSRASDAAALSDSTGVEISNAMLKSIVAAEQERMGFHNGAR